VWKPHLKSEEARGGNFGKVWELEVEKARCGNLDLKEKARSANFHLEVKK